MVFSVAAPLVQMAWNGEMEEATRLLSRSWKKWKDGNPSAEGVADMSKKVSALRNNLALVPTDLFEAFKHAADLQDDWSKDAVKSVAHGQPHHYNIEKNEQGELTLVNPDSVMAPESYDLAFMIGNPWHFDKSVEENEEFLYAPENVGKQMDIIATETGVAKGEIMIATVCHCFNSAAKRYWAIENNAVRPNDVGPESFLKLADSVLRASAASMELVA